MESFGMNRCIIDNWSLANAAWLLEGGLTGIQADETAWHLRALDDHIVGGSPSGDELPHHAQGIDTPSAYLGSLSNLATGILLFDSLAFVENGFERSWTTYEVFTNETSDLLVPLAAPPRLDSEYYGDQIVGGLNFYLYMAKTHSCDVMLNPVRSSHLTQELRLDDLSHLDYIQDLLQAVDCEVRKRIESSPSRIVRLGAIANLRLPPILHLVLSQCTSRADILEVARQMRNLKPAQSLRSVLGGVTGASCSSERYPLLIADLEEIARDLTHEIISGKHSGSFGPTFFGLFTVSYDWEKVRYAEDHRVFLRNLMWCRMEIDGARRRIDEILK